MRALLCAAIVAAGATGARGVVEDLTYPPDLFQKQLGKGKPTFLLFFAPWCRHCTGALQLWEELAAAVDANPAAAAGLNIAKLDANENAIAGNDYEVTEFPSVRWVPQGSTQSSPYSKGMDIASLLVYLNDKLGTIVQPAPTKAPSGDGGASTEDRASRAERIKAFQQEHMATLQKIADEEGLDAAKDFLALHNMEDIIKVTTPDHLGQDGDGERDMLRKMAETRGVEGVREFLQGQGLDTGTINEVLKSVGLETTDAQQDPGYDEWDF